MPKNKLTKPQNEDDSIYREKNSCFILPAFYIV